MKYPLSKWALKRLGIIPVFFLSLFSDCSAQVYNTDAICLALGGCYSTGPAGSTGISNEAVLGFADPASYQVSHIRPFVIKELGISSINAKFSLFPGKMHTGLQHYGIPGFQQLVSYLGYGMKLSDNIYAGVGFRYYSTFTQEEWSYLRSFGVSGGVLIHAGESTWLGAHIINPVTVNNYNGHGSLFPSIVTLGIRRDIYSSSNILGELSYNSNTGPVSRIAAEYRYSEKVIIRVGYHSNPASLSFGTGLLIFPMKLDIAFSYSVRRGIIPALTISYLTGK